MSEQTAVTGTIRGYTDAMGRGQTAVDGPRGTFLITRKSDRDLFEVWKSDSLSTAYRDGNAGRCLSVACRLAGVAV